MALFPLRASSWAIAAVMLFFAVVAIRSGGRQGDIIRSDAKGYHGYLHALFITHDLGHETVQEEYVHDTRDGTLNKYFAGEALLLLPFFLAAHVYTLTVGGRADGFSPPYEHAVSMAALFYALVGLLALRALLRALALRETLVALLLLAIGFGTQLGQYVAVQPGWSHVYSFSMVCLFLLITHHLAHGAPPRTLIPWAVVLAVIILIRPVNALVVLAIPVVLGERCTRLFHIIRTQRRTLLLACTVFTAVLAVQSALWYAQVGHVVAYGYKGEGFIWTEPHLREVLFSVRRGLFVWTPIMCIAAIAMFALVKHDRIRAVAALLYFAALTYVVGCWWIWYYGTGFGNRVFIEHYPILLLPLALMLERWHGWRSTLAQGSLVLFSLFTLAQFHQYRHGILSTTHMAPDTYAYTFMRFDNEHRDRLGGLDEIHWYAPNGLDTLIKETCTDATQSHWHGRSIGTDAGRPIFVCDTTDEFGPTFGSGADEIPVERKLHVRVQFLRKAPDGCDTRAVLAVCTIDGHHGAHKGYTAFPMDPMPPKADTWQPITYNIPMPAMQAGDVLKFYFWNTGHKTRFEVKDLSIIVLGVTPF